MLKLLKILSFANIALGALCVVLNVTAIVAFNSNLRFMHFFDRVMDVVGYGIWTGMLYAVSGFLGISVCFTKNQSTMSFLRFTTLLSFASSVTMIVLTGINGEQIRVNINNWCVSHINGQYLYFYNDCNIWMSLEWTLLALGLLGFLLNLLVTWLIYPNLYVQLGMCGIRGPWVFASDFPVGGFRNVRHSSASKQTQV